MFEYTATREEQLKLEVEKMLEGIKHPDLRGKHAEEILKEYLKEVLPTRYAIGSGLVVDACGNKSKQSDIVIYDPYFSPKYRTMGGYSMFMSETVYAVIEVKLSLGTRELLNNKVNCFDNIASVKKLKKDKYTKELPLPIGWDTEKNINVITHPSKTIGVVFGFQGGPKQKTLQKNILAKFNERQESEICESSPDVIFRLNAGMSIIYPKRYGLEIDGQTINQPIATFSEDRDSRLYDFTLTLIKLLNTSFMPPVDLYAYQKYL